MVVNPTSQSHTSCDYKTHTVISTTVYNILCTHPFPRKTDETLTHGTRESRNNE